MLTLLWWHWALYIGVNLITFAAYSWISWRLYKKRKDSNTPLMFADSFLFEAFVFTCGLHHLVHPLGMLGMVTVMKSSMGPMMTGIVGMTVPTLFWNIFYIMLIVDAIMAAFSVLSARFLKLN